MALLLKNVDEPASLVWWLNVVFAALYVISLALTYRALGQPAKAIEYYESYLRDSPQATDRASVEAAIAEERLKLPTA